ncbi:MAG: spermidine/putrescine ABC transporter substrate-binding protein [Verrucomicrobiae bacterium]|nr:spermidine/putrescine ABC transporter substrate-binding protein [Verrucomicrobiae bacterium]
MRVQADGSGLGLGPALAARWAILLLLILGAVRAGAAERLNVFIWSEYLDPAVVADFEKSQDAAVTVDLYEEADGMLAKLQGGGSAQYDVVCVPDNLVPAAIQLQLLAPLRRDRIPNLRNLDPKFTRLSFDPPGAYTVPYQWGTLVLYYRVQPGKPPPDSWAAVFDPAASPGAFVLLDSARDTVGAALKYRGFSFNATEPACLKEARDLVLAAKERALGFENSVAGRNRVLAKTAALAMVYSGEAARGMAEDPGTACVIPREGSEIWLDTLAVTARAPHRDLAERFLNWVLDARQGARIAAFTRSGTPNAAAREFLPATLLTNTAVYPPPEVMSRLEFLEDLGPKTRLYDQVWTQIKAR